MMVEMLDRLLASASAHRWRCANQHRDHRPSDGEAMLFHTSAMLGRCWGCWARCWTCWADGRCGPMATRFAGGIDGQCCRRSARHEIRLMSLAQWGQKAPETGQSEQATQRLRTQSSVIISFEACLQQVGSSVASCRQNASLGSASGRATRRRERTRSLAILDQKGGYGATLQCPPTVTSTLPSARMRTRCRNSRSGHMWKDGSTQHLTKGLCPDDLLLKKLTTPPSVLEALRSAIELSQARAAWLPPCPVRSHGRTADMDTHGQVSAVVSRSIGAAACVLWSAQAITVTDKPESRRDKFTPIPPSTIKRGATRYCRPALDAMEGSSTPGESAEDFEWLRLPPARSGVSCVPAARGYQHCRNGNHHALGERLYHRRVNGALAKKSKRPSVPRIRAIAKNQSSRLSSDGHRSCSDATMPSSNWPLPAHPPPPDAPHICCSIPAAARRAVPCSNSPRVHRSGRVRPTRRQCRRTGARCAA